MVRHGQMCRGWGHGLQDAVLAGVTAAQDTNFSRKRGCWGLQTSPEWGGQWMMTKEEETGRGFLLNQLSRILPEGRPEGPDIQGGGWGIWSNTGDQMSGVEGFLTKWLSRILAETGQCRPSKDGAKLRSSWEETQWPWLPSPLVK